MLNNRKELVKRFLKEGFTHRTLSSFSDTQLKTLSKKLFNEAETTTVKKTTYNKSEVDKMKQDDGGLNVDGTVTPNEDGSVTVTTNEEKNIETDPMGNPDVDIDGEPLLVELPQEVEEKFDSKAQQKHLYSVNPAAAEKLASKMTKSDYQKLPEYVNEQKMLEEWICGLVESNEPPVITKGNFIKTIKESLSNQDVDSPYTIGTEAQQESFASVLDIANEMEPPMTVEVDGFDDEGHMNGYLQNPSDEQIIDLSICPTGNIKLNGNVLGGMELSETDRDNDGEYMGAPEATTAPAPLKTPTIAPSKPGEKKRRGPFEKPKTRPNPKARGNNSSLPDWLKSTNLGKSLTQHG
jgi:hypothetical protein